MDGSHRGRQFAQFGFGDQYFQGGRAGMSRGTGGRGGSRDERGNERGRGAGRARGNWRDGARGARSIPYQDPLEGQPMGDLLDTISPEQLRSSTAVAPTITDCKYIASYNWMDKEEAAILVPGAPPMWSPPKQTPSLKEDSGHYFRDPNAARYPNYPTEPAIRAIFALSPSFEPSKIDIVGCGSTLGQLLNFANSRERTFRFYVEKIGNTVFLARKENSATQLIEDVKGYGHTFPEAYTNWEADVKGSVSHQRLITYNFAGLRCLVRYQSDGYLKDKVGPEYSKPPPLPDVKHSFGDDSISSLARAAQSIAVGEKDPEKCTVLTVKLGGHKVPQSAVLDLKTRAAHRQIDMEEVLPRLYVSQTRRFVIGYHKSGQFDDIQVQDVKGSINEWEKRNEALLDRFHSVLHHIRDFVERSDRHKVEIRRYGTGPLEIRKQCEKGWSALPPELKAQWAGEPFTERSESDKLKESRDEALSDDESGDDDLDDYLRF